ncbi:386_t:CDS:10, partial [Gigaspora margarita]
MVAELNIYNIKSLGQVSTPDIIVDFMLDAVGYQGETILNKHILDNSCGDGAFLKSIVKRYIKAAKEKNLSQKEIKKGLETYIHGVEIDRFAYENCVKNLNAIFSANYDLKLADALFVRNYDKKMDFVVGNPPYVKIHNLNGEYKSIISQKELKGMQLNPAGKLIYITPSYFKSASSKILREKICQEKKLVHIYNFKHQQIFPNITTYPVISLFDNSHCSQKFNYSAAELKNGSENKKNHCEVKNAFATLADGIFIADKFSFTSADIIKVVKSSTGEIKECIFPYRYDKEAKRYLLKDFAELESNTQKYLLNFQFQLKNSLFNKEFSNIKLGLVPAEMGIYGGVYVLPNGTEPKEIENHIRSEKFKEFVKVFGEHRNELDNLNQEFLKCLERSFLKYLEKGAKGVRGTGKLKILHPHIANDLRNILDRILTSRSSYARKNWRKIKVLIIDEISMLGGELFDKLESLARQIRQSEQPFGGIQLILAGDFCQLPPVGKSPLYCFAAKAWENCIRETVNLTQPTWPDDGIRPVSLYATSQEAEATNNHELAQLSAPSYLFVAEDQEKEPGKLKELIRDCLAATKLELKIGAQVMLITNYLERKLVNGSQGVVIGFVKGLPRVKFTNGKILIIEKHTWEKIESYDNNNRPGQTIERLKVDLSKCFVSGQIYVALSRARDPQLLQVINFPYRRLWCDYKVQKYYSNLNSAGENEVPVIILSLVSATLILFFLLTVLHNIGQLTLNNEEIKLLKVELEKEKMLTNIEIPNYFLLRKDEFGSNVYCCQKCWNENEKAYLESDYELIKSYVKESRKFYPCLVTCRECGERIVIKRRDLHDEKAKSDEEAAARRLAQSSIVEAEASKEQTKLPKEQQIEKPSHFQPEQTSSVQLEE